MKQSVTQLVNRYKFDSRYHEQLVDTIRELQSKLDTPDTASAYTLSPIEAYVYEDDCGSPMLSDVEKEQLCAYLRTVSEQSRQYAFMHANWSDGHGGQHVCDIDVYKVVFTAPGTSPFVLDVKLNGSEVIESIVSCEGVFKMVMCVYDPSEPVGYYQDSDSDPYIEHHKDAESVFLPSTNVGNTTLKELIWHLSTALLIHFCREINQGCVDGLIWSLNDSFDDAPCTDTL